MAAKKVSGAKKDQHGPRRPIWLPLDLAERVKAMAAAGKRPVSWEVRRILTEAIDAWEAEAGRKPPAT